MLAVMILMSRVLCTHALPCKVMMLIVAALYTCRCDSCSTTTNDKCRADLGCTSPCCLDTYGSCLVPGQAAGTITIDPAYCCPSNQARTLHKKHPT